MSPKALPSRHTIESCTLQIHNWRPFHLPTALKTLDPTAATDLNPSSSKRPCLLDRATSFSIDAALDMSRLSLFDDNDRCGQKVRWMARKRRRRGSRSVSGRSSDRSGTRRRCCSVGASAAHATCSDFPVAAGTDSSGELFVNGDANWASDASEAARNSRRESNGEREGLSSGVGGSGSLDTTQGVESGYGSEPGYRGDAEFGDGDEIDEEEDDQRLLFWGNAFEDTDINMEMVGENTLQKAHHRCRRKKHDLKMMIDAV